VKKATTLLATVVGQDIEEGADGLFRIVRGVAKDRIISTVDPEARHGHKTASRHFDGYKCHIAVDAESEIITATEVTAGNVGDASAAEALLADILKGARDESQGDATHEDARYEVLGDSSYGTAELVEKLEHAGVVPNVKVQPPSGLDGMFSQDDFEIDTKAGVAHCPARVRVSLQVMKDGSRVAEFGANCTDCALRAQCTKSKSGRSLRIHPKHATLDRHRKLQPRAPRRTRRTHRTQHASRVSKLMHQTNREEARCAHRPPRLPRCTLPRSGRP